MIYDCFTFFNELDLLEIRLNVLNDYVDKFVLVESTKTFTGMDKPLYYKENKERFSHFNDKIIHIVLDETPNEYAWHNECIQRNSISKGLTNCNDDDIILISDLDEIPTPEFIHKYKDIEGIKLFEINQYCYFLNCKAISQGVWLLGPKMLSYKDFKHYTDDKQEFIP
ncbi:MAG: glycosyl transferase GT17 family protein, partial [Candidatus Gastranaerophilaceae bacterium]